MKSLKCRLNSKVNLCANNVFMETHDSEIEIDRKIDGMKGRKKAAETILKIL